MNGSFVREHKTRRENEGVFSYSMNIKMKFTSLTGRSIPDQLKPNIDAVFQEISQELDDRIAKIFDDYDEEPVE